MASDGSIILETQISDKGLKKGLSDINKTATKSADSVEDVDNATAELGDALKKAEKEAKKSAKSLDEVGDSSKDMKGSISAATIAVGEFAGNALTTLVSKVGEAISNFISLADETREYREDMAKLETAFNNANFSTEAANKAYNDFYKILGESDRSVEAVNHLAELTNNEEELAKWSTICAGVTAKFGDSLPIEGLTEAANETAKVGQVTGPLADALNWAGISEDKFNDKLEKCKNEQARSALITETLNGLYKEAADEYNNLTAETQAARDATNQMEQAQAKIGDALEPVITAWKKLKSQALEKIAPVIEEVTGALSNLMSDISNQTKTTKAFEKFGQSIGNIISAATQKILQFLKQLIPQMISLGKQIIQGIISGITTEMPVLSTAAMTITAVFAAIKITTFVQNIVSGFNSIMTVLNAYKAATAVSQSASVLLASSMTPLQLAIGLLTGKIELATVAQAAWNAVKMLDPTVLLVAGVVALTAAVAGAAYAYGKHLEKSSALVASTKQLADAAAEAKERANELSDSIANLGETASNTIENAEAEAYANSVLADELYNLADQTELTASQKERMRNIVDELNDNMSGLNLQLNEENGTLNMTRESMKEYIAQSLEVAKAKAMQELYTEALKEQYKAQAEAKSNADKLIEAENKLNEIKSQGTQVTRTIQGVTYTYTEYTGEQTKAMRNCEKAIKEYGEALKTNKDTIQQSSESLESIAAVAGVELPASFEEGKAQTQGFFDELDRQVKESTGNSPGLGTDYADGYLQSIRDKYPEAYKTGQGLANEAYRGTQDAQDSHSPAKETIKLGEYFDEGYIIGITNGYDDAGNAGENLAKTALEGVKDGTEDLVSYVSNAFKALTEDTRSEVQKVIDESNEELLESEKKYNKEKERIDKLEVKSEERIAYEAEKKRQKYLEKQTTAQRRANEELLEQMSEKADAADDLIKESNQKYLDELKETAEKERKLYDARQKDIENLKKKVVDAYSDIAQEAVKSIEDLEKIQETFAKKLADYGGLTEKKTTASGKEKTVLSNLDKQVTFLENYEKSLKKIKETKNVPDEFFEMIRDMGVEEGAEYANALLKLSDKDFQEYVANWKKKQEVSQRISKELYKDEAAQLALEVNNKFDEVENEFFGVGENAADNFESGFLDELESVIRNIKDSINSAFSTVAVPISASSGGVAGVQSAITNIPALARGAVLPANRPFLARLGDQRNGTNLEAPASLIRNMVEEALDSRGLTGGQSNQVIREEHYNLNQTELMTVLYKLVKGGERLNGTNLVKGGTY